MEKKIISFRDIKKIGILGGGSWGCALANLLSLKGYNVFIWEKFPLKAQKLSIERKLEFLPEIMLINNIYVTNDLEEAVKDKDLIIFVLPSNFVREVAKSIQLINRHLKNCFIVSAVKGIEIKTLSRMSQVIQEEISSIKKDNVMVLSGPSFAVEVSRKLPTTIVLAGKNNFITKEIQKVFSTQYFRVYTQNDIAGVELGGALKNIFAIACGIIDGIGFGDNTKAGLITRGLREMIKLGVKLGGKMQTFLGLAGVGDLMMTCFSKHSRNRLLGEKIGLGIIPEEALKEISTTAEGYLTAKASYFLGKKLKLDLPIINEIYYLLYKRKNIDDAVKNLMLRKLKSEAEPII